MDNVDIRLRISSEIKDEAELVFHEMGMTLSEAIRIIIKQPMNSRGLPFKPHVKKPNLETLQAFKESEERDYIKSSLAEFKQSLNID